MGIPLVLASLCISSSNLRAEPEGEINRYEGMSYTFYLPDQIEVAKPFSNAEMYSFEWKKNDRVFFVLYVTPVSVTAATPESMIDEFENAYEEPITTMGTQIISKERKPLERGVFSGIEVAYKIKTKDGEESLQHTLLLTDGVHLWNGLLATTDTNDIERVYYILENAKKMGE